MVEQRNLTKAQARALAFLAAQDEVVALYQFLNAGHGRALLMPLCKLGWIDWTSSFSVASCATLEEFRHAQITTSYVSITDAGRAALNQEDSNAG